MKIPEGISGYNKDAFDTFWYWINERHRVYLNRQEFLPKPWSEDPIFQDWKFCNVFRNLDAESSHLIANYESHQRSSPAEIIFNTYLFRAFNKYETFYSLGGWQTDWNPKATTARLQALEFEGKKIFSGAYMIRGREGMPKYESVVATLDDIWCEREVLEFRFKNLHSLEKGFDILIKEAFWGWANFTTYQVLLDLTYTRVLENPSDINTWCEFGPGAQRGIRLIFPDTTNGNQLERTRFLLEAQKYNLEPHVPTLTLQDIEFSLCELQKYMRIRNGGRSKTKYNGRAI